MLTPFLDVYGIEYRFRPAGLSLSQSIKDATNWGANLYVPMHTNAAGGKAIGTRFGFYPGRMDSSNACNIFKKNWLRIYPYSEKVKTGTYTFYEAKNPVCPSVYCELVFHDNITDATWFHQNMETIARNLAQSIAEVLGAGVKPSDPKEEESKPENNDDYIVNVKITRQENADFFNKKIGDVVSIPVEQYVLGVVPSELGTELKDTKAHEAGKAQAIAARTVAFARTKGGKTITDDSKVDQAYRAERSADTAFTNSHKAVVETTGKVLYYNGKLADSTVYSHSNGGKIHSPNDAGWPGTQPYLVSKDDPYTPAPKKGHGVGLSQMGAIKMSALGKSFEDILAFYYPGTTIASEIVKPATPPVASKPDPKPVEEKPEQPPIIENPVDPELSKDALYFAEVITRNPVSLNIWSNTRKNKSLKVVPKGALVEVLQIVDGTWAKVRYDGVTGYSDRQYLKRKGEPADVLYMAKVKTRFPLSLNGWQNPNKGKSLIKIPNRATVEVLQEYNYTWAKIRYKNTVVYSDRQYLEKI